MAPEKSYVTVEQHICPVCGTTFDTGTVLLAKQMRDVFKSHAMIGIDLCPRCWNLKNEDYVALVECDPEKTDSYTDDSGQVVSRPQDACRTGNVVHMPKHIFEKLFTIPVPETMMCYLEPDAFEKMKEIVDIAEERLSLKTPLDRSKLQ